MSNPTPEPFSSPEAAGRAKADRAYGRDPAYTKLIDDKVAASNWTSGQNKANPYPFPRDQFERGVERVRALIPTTAEKSEAEFVQALIKAKTDPRYGKDPKYTESIRDIEQYL